MSNATIDVLHTDKAKRIVWLLTDMMNDSTIPERYRRKIKAMLISEKHDSAEIYELMLQ